MRYLTLLIVLVSSFSFAQTPEQIEAVTKEYIQLAYAGDSQAQYMLYQAYLNGFGVEQSESTALAWLNKSAESSFPDAVFELGQRYMNGVGVGFDEAKGISLLLKAAELKAPSANSALGAYYLGVYKDFEPIDSAKAMEYLLLAAEQKDSNGMLYLGLMYLKGIEPNANSDDDLNVKQAIHWLEMSAEYLNPYSYGNLAIVYLEPFYNNHSPEKAYFWLSVAKQLGAQQSMGAITKAELALSSGQRTTIQYKASEWVKSHNK